MEPNVRWAPSGRAVYFKGVSRGVRNLWKVTVDPRTLRWVAGPERLTTGFHDTDIALSPNGKRLAFSVRQESTRAWSLPFDARAGRLRGDAQPVTATGMNPEGLNVSRVGTHLLYVASRPGTNERELLEKSLDDNRETVLAVSDVRIFTPCWSRDGTRIAYAGRRPAYSGRDAFSINVLPAGGGEEQIVASGADDLTWDWSADGRWLLVGSDREKPEAMGRARAVSPVGRATRRGATARDYVARRSTASSRPAFHPTIAGSCSRQQELATTPPSTSSPRRAVPGRASPRTIAGRTSHAGRRTGRRSTTSRTASRGFSTCGASAFDPAGGQPVGEPFRVTSFDSPGRMVWPEIGPALIALSAGRLVLPITEVTGSIWVLDNVDE